MRLTWLPTILRTAGLEVVEHPGWAMRGLPWLNPPRSVVWHHDASPPGDSPGVPTWMAGQISAGQAGAQLWVDRAGRWHVVAAGVCWHTGAVLPGRPGNYQGIGVETDHTTGEDWPTAQLTSLRRGTAAILGRLARRPTELHFHKTICYPPGRKTDPDGLTLSVERNAVATAHEEDDDMDETTLKRLLREERGETIDGLLTKLAKILDPAADRETTNGHLRRRLEVVTARGVAKADLSIDEAKLATSIAAQVVAGLDDTVRDALTTAATRADVDALLDEVARRLSGAA